ncbi:MAG: site-specific tyrosine recombinase XerD [SAR202 cluster bacterium]|nr:site-specific tyrosine recombinase XerD [SAR202 cluster bacterium]
MQTEIDRFLQVLAIEKGFSPNTQAAYRNDLHQLVEYLQSSGGASAWGEVTPDTLSGFILAQKGRGYSNATMARKIASLKSFFGFLGQEGLITRDPAEDIASPKLGRRIPKPLTEGEMARLLEVASQAHNLEALRDRAILELLYATGMRVSELVALDLAQLNLAEGNGYVRCIGKGDKERVVQLHDAAVQAIRAYLIRGRPNSIKDDGDERAVFVNRRGERLTRQGCWLILKEHAHRAGITTHVTPHVLRHSFATHMLRGGATLRQVQEWLGHASITTTQVYTLLTDQHVREEYDKAHPRAR